MYERELNALIDGATVVTANNRLARTLRHAFEEHQARAGAAVWLTPDVVSWSAWLRRLWQLSRLEGGSAAQQTLLPDSAADYLWQHSIAEIEGEQAGLPIAHFARGARAAWRLLNDWQGKAAAEWTEPNLSVDQRAFLRWSGRYRDQCRAAAWVDTEQLAELLTADIADGLLGPDAPLVFTGFDLWPPAWAALRDACRAAGAGVVNLDPPALDAGRRLTGHPCAAPDEELWRAADWARSILTERPDAVVGVVVPDLATRAPAVRRIFLDVLAPDWRLEQPPHDLPLNVSYGAALSAEPMIGAALRLLGLLRGTAEFADLSLLLRSPWLAGGLSEAPARARAELYLRRTLQVECEVAAALRHSREAAPEFARILAAVAATGSGAVHPRSARDWARIFTDLLQNTGWPGERAMDSRTYQAVEAWNELLADFAASAGVLGSIGVRQALALLQQLAAQRLFQPEGREGGVQIVGVLEAAGHEFDALWLSGMASELWPPVVRPSPYLPLPLQRRLGLPDSSPGQALALARGRTERLLCAAPELCVSWPTELDGEPTLGLTPLVASPDLMLATGAGSVSSWNRRVLGVAPTVVLQPDEPPAWPADRVTRGGAALLTRQATSPADAFIEHRLGGKLLEPPGFGITPRQKGELMHLALEVLYRAAPSQQQLRNLDPAARRRLLERTIRAAAARLPGAGTPLLQRLTELELARQLELLERWVDLDLERQEFTAVQVELATEAAEIGPLTLRLKLDRLDTLADGGLLVVDYKTGRVNRQVWNPTRPGDLQLPLYVSALAPRAAGVAFAQVSPHGVGYDGVGQPGLDIPGMRSPGTRKSFEVRYTRPDTGAVIDSWDELREVWHERLERLAFEFAAGDFRLDPCNPQSGRGQFAVLTRLFDAGFVLADEDMPVVDE